MPEGQAFDRIANAGAAGVCLVCGLQVVTVDGAPGFRRDVRCRYHIQGNIVRKATNHQPHCGADLTEYGETGLWLRVALELVTYLAVSQWHEFAPRRRWP